jgi:hypothetical protein
VGKKVAARAVRFCVADVLAAYVEVPVKSA